MIRRAVIDHLRKNVPALCGRVYQAFTVNPKKEPKPYATVKIVPGPGSTRVGFAGHDEIEVRVYGEQTDFTDLDVVVDEVIAALNGRFVQDPETGELYEVSWVPGVLDYVDEDLLARLVRFRAGSLRERG
ncbi:MAG: hypothetical protein DIU55_008125 [Bacillota bacterium]